MKYGLAAALVLFVCLVAVFMNTGKAPPAVPVVQESVKEPVERMTPYQYGYLKGKRNLMIQMGIGDVAPLPSVAEYATSESSSEESQEEEELKGYVDGYHRAAELMFDPRGCTR
jgi:hypothetical protein